MKHSGFILLRRPASAKPFTLQYLLCCNGLLRTFGTHSRNKQASAGLECDGRLELTQNPVRLFYQIGLPATSTFSSSGQGVRHLRFCPYPRSRPTILATDHRIMPHSRFCLPCSVRSANHIHLRRKGRSTLPILPSRLPCRCGCGNQRSNTASDMPRNPLSARSSMPLLQPNAATPVIMRNTACNLRFFCSNAIS